MALLYADEDFDYSVVESLRRMGHDVLTVQEAGRRGRGDDLVLADATAGGRAVLTHNRWDFDRLHRQNAVHGGIISCSRDDDADAMAGRIDQAIVGATVLAGQHIRVDRQAKP
jgi:Domain of unknown function (DUF5615)